MRIVTIAALVLAAFVSLGFGNSDCAESANVVSPSLSPDARSISEGNLKKARADFDAAPESADAAIWLGRRTAYLGKYKEAIGIYTEAIGKHPEDARLYRHRGHRYLSIRCFADAVTDLEKAADLVKGKPDEVEPDGLPNARNIPTSTLQSNIFYHLGLAYYLQGDFRNALKAYKKCLKVSKNPDMFVATQNWHYLTLRRLGKIDDSVKVLRSVREGLDVIENDTYYKLLKLYQNKVHVATLLSEIRDSDDSLQNATMGYGIGTYFLVNGDRENAESIYKKILETDQWSSFGYIAAEAEMK